MNRTSTLIVFEHETLCVGSKLDERAFRSLVRYHSTVSDAFFDIGYDRIKLKQYVGIIHVDGLTIEVLPKIDRSGYDSNVVLWRTALLEMLSASGILNAEVLQNAPQRVGKTSLFDILVLQFSNAVQKIVREGLIRKYRTERGNVKSLKGKLLFAQHVNQNLTKPDKWYTEHNVYDRNHSFNGILKHAIDVLYPICSSSLKQKLHVLRLDFIDIPSFLPDVNYIERLHYDRRTERYREAIELAWLVLQNLSPELKSGRSSVFAILFDMNKLFERTVLHLLKVEAFQRNDGTVVVGKKSCRFWQRMWLQPDVIIQKGDKNIVIDTKWKLTETGVPSEQDIRQVFVYGLYFSAKKVVILYPGNGKDKNRNSNYESIPNLSDFDLSCLIEYADLVTENGTINTKFAVELLNRLMYS